MKKTKYRFVSYVFFLITLLSVLQVCFSKERNIDNTEKWKQTLIKDPSKDIKLFTENNNEVSVCFITSGHLEERNIVRIALEESWGKVSALRFTGFEDCPKMPSKEVVPILFDINNNEGGWGGKSKPGMGNRDSEGWQIRLGVTPKKNKLASSAIHEMGHVLGFAHEQRREGATRCNDTAVIFTIGCNDNDDCKRKESVCRVSSDCQEGGECLNSKCSYKQNICDVAARPNNTGLRGRCVSDQSPTILENEEVIKTPYFDSDSIMNYCRPEHHPFLTEEALSPWDIVGVQKAYGRKPVHSIVGINNRCIDVHNPGWQPLKEASKLQAWQCIGNANQNWAWSEDHFGLEWPNDSYKYMDVQWGNTADGTPLWNWIKNTSSAQQWHFNNASIIGIGGLCLEAVDPLIAGTGVRVSYCDGSAKQKWSFPETQGDFEDYKIKKCGKKVNNVELLCPEKIIVHQIRNQLKIDGKNNLCLKKSDKTGAILATCDTRSLDQLFLLESRNIKSGYPKTCLNVWNSDAKPKQKVDFSSSCQNLDGDMWFIKGNINGLADKCVDLDVASPVKDGSKIQLWTCGNQRNQIWDYYF